MLSIFIFKSVDLRGMHYGMGTYVKQLVAALLKYTKVSVYVINYHSNKYKEFTVLPDLSGHLEIHIPSPKLYQKTKVHEARYGRIIAGLLTDIINELQNVIFQVNYLDDLEIVKELKARFSYPVISVIHSAQWQLAFNGNKQKFIEAWNNSISGKKILPVEIKTEQKFYELSDKIISVTGYMKEFVMQYYSISNEKVSVVQNGIEGSSFYIPDTTEKQFLKKALGFSPDDKIVLFSGRLDDAKGIYHLIDAFAEVIKINEKIRLIVAGSGKYSACFTHCKGFWGKVTFTGLILYEDMLKLYQIADIGIIPSIYDHCPYVALEMMAHKIPLIISKTEGLNEIMNETQSVFIIPKIEADGKITFDIKEMVEAILYMADNENLCSELAGRSFELVTSGFSAERMAMETLDIYYEVCKPLKKDNNEIVQAEERL